MKKAVKASAGLFLLFGSRASGLLVAVLFVPLYAKLLNPHDFGIATIVLSGQVFAIAFDLGMATLTARDAAAHTDHTTTATQLRRAERLLINLYLVTTPVATGVFAALDWPIWQVVACMCMFLALTLQNLYMNFLLGKSMHKQVAFGQSLGTMARAVFCAAALMTIHATLEVFILSQLVGAVAHMALTRWLCTRRSLALSPTTHAPQNRREFSVRTQVALARRGLPLFMVGVAGAITLNADKPIVGLFFGAESLVPYFLAATFSLTPIGLLAGPVAQYFQPRIVKAHVAKDSVAISATISQLLLALVVTVVVPTLILWMFREEIVTLWLRQETLVPEVSRLSSWLLPAAAIGAIGNLPLAIIIAAGDFTFQAKLSIALAAFVLIAVATGAANGNLVYVCAAYLGYYVLASSALWWRSIQFDFAKTASRLAAVRTMIMTLGLSLVLFLYSTLVHTG